MDTTAIKALIDKYSIIQVGDKIGTRTTKGLDRDAFQAEVKPHKAEIIQYFAMQRQATQAKADAEQATFDAIPGVAELRKARTQAAQWQAAFARMMETGDSKMDAIEHPTPQQLAEMEAKYPQAVFALEAERRAATTGNYRLSAIWTETYKALRAGKDPDTVKADHDARMAEYTKSVMFD